MAFTKFQKLVCNLIAQNRIRNGESYIAGGVALNCIIKSARISNDIDIFHDTQDALQKSWDEDRYLLIKGNYRIEIIRERQSFIEALISKDHEKTLMQWTCDSSFRFFPLIKHHDLGLTLHPFDLATNKVLALVGRLEIRDWIDVINCDTKIQPLGLLAWAACGKDPGFNPLQILEEAGRSSHYTKPELKALSFEGDVPDIGKLSKSWKQILTEAKETINLLPYEEVGKAVVDHKGKLFNRSISDLKRSQSLNQISYHCGTIKGVLPNIVR
ncbi:MAG: hypothetical protein GY941_29385 [Planctomycetes bacterium]|nr:hypothetical protein [Planctomycetota bacterium]